MLMMPITVIKVRYESNLYRYKSFREAWLSIYRQDGVKGFFYGAAATGMRDAPFAGTYVMFYEGMKPALSRILLSTPLSSNSTGPSHSTVVNLSASVISGVTSTALTQPFDVLKTRIQLRPAEYRNSYLGFLKIAKEEGYRGFFIGLMPRVLRKSLSSAITWTVYEELAQFLMNRNAQAIQLK
ncbi:hypothetical protein HDU97_010181 [Phlyctochytrium planicorne]|nr:hypothetical protein HDU97_010181 [Phlyctochytrium planicorne]